MPTSTRFFKSIVVIPSCIAVLWLFLFLIKLDQTSAASGTDYYISPSGNDIYAGTSPGSAWKTIAKVNRVVFSPGDRILFQGGQKFAGSLYFDASDRGTATSPIIISSYGAGRATINAGAGHGLFVYNSGGFVVQNLNFAGAGAATNTKSGVLFYTDLPGNTKLEHVYLNNLDVSRFGDYGVVIGAWNGKSGFRDVRITNVSSHDNVMGGIMTYGFFDPTATGYAHENVYIGSSKAYNNSGKAGLSSPSGSGIVLSDVNGGIIERSVAYNNGWLNTASSGPVGIWAWDTNNVTIQFNESYWNRTNSSVDGGGFDLDGGITNSVMQYNYSHNNDGPGFSLYQFKNARSFSNNTIRYNVSENDGRKNSPGGIHLWNGGSGITNAEIYNNTIFMKPAQSGRPKGMYIQTPVKNVRVRNNIFITTSGLELGNVISGQSNVLFQGNVYWPSGDAFSIRWGGTTYSSVNAWRTATGQEKVDGVACGFVVDPRLASPGHGGTVGDARFLKTLTAYQLRPDSALHDAGLNLKDRFGVVPGPYDFFENALPLGKSYSVGAHEAVQPAISFGRAAHFALDEGKGSTVGDISGSGNSGRHMNGPSWTSGILSGALKFDGVDDYMQVTNSPNLENIQESSYSVSAWFKPLTTPPGRGSANNAYYGIIIKNGRHLGLRYNYNHSFAMDHWLAGNIQQTAASASSFASGRFYHVVGVVDRGSGRTSLYVNGVLEGVKTWTPNAAAREYDTTTWKIGIAAPGASTWRWAAHGVIDDVRIYNRALSDQEVANIFNSR